MSADNLHISLKGDTSNLGRDLGCMDERLGRLTAAPCVCGHPAAAHDAPAGPCHLCDPEHAHHRYEPEETP